MRDKNDEPGNHAGPAPIPDAETEASVHVRVAKRPKVVPELDDAVEQTPLAGPSTSQNKGKDKAILAGPGSVSLTPATLELGAHRLISSYRMMMRSGQSFLAVKLESWFPLSHRSTSLRLGLITPQ